MKLSMILAFAALSTVPVLADYNFISIIDNADPTFNQALGINNAGTIAGYFGSGAPNGTPPPFTLLPNKGYTVTPPYSQANFSNENFPGSSQTQVTGINNTGTTVGFYADSNGATTPNFIGFVDQSGTFTAVQDPSTPVVPSSLNQLLGVNDGNVAAGFYQDALGNSHGYTYNIGTASFNNFLLPSGDNALSFAATGINNAGTVVGFFTNLGGTTEGFVDNGGTFTNFLALGSNNTMFLGINNNGDAVGVYQDGSGFNHGFVYSIASGTYQSVDDPNAVFLNGGTTINGINDKGDLVGFYGDANGNTIGLLANPVPEPSYLSVLLLAGLAFAGIKQARR
ncbi:MAG TPA: hypothetical protein VGP62_18960 [Bryobacteraceae bacterium]|jgi:probable HAF family extracellular repeat protein|nr:hypothetical protein [Bryobacteraceae bacterium]